jgi:DNA mismatch repair protein MutS
VANVHLPAVEHGSRIVFLHRVEAGPASQSYGIQVARLAGVPAAVIRAAKARLAKLEQEAASENVQGDLFAPQAQAQTSSEPSELLARLNEIDPNALSPKAALELVYELKKTADQR